MRSLVVRRMKNLSKTRMLGGRLSAAAVLFTLFVATGPHILAAAFAVPLFAATAASARERKNALTSDAVKTVAVAGATGRTGSLVVQELLGRDVGVVAMVRDLEKAKEKFPDPNPKLTVLKCDLGSEEEICSAVEGCDAAIWCATGFSDSPETSYIDKIKRLFKVAVTPKESIDAVGVPALAKAFSSKEGVAGQALPKVVMLSSAGVTRPSWDEEKKSRFSGSAEIPIVRLNPFGILDIKADSEEKLRQSGVDYCIVRPAGLNDKWPSGSRPVLSQGDVAVGRINRKDVACILVDVLTEAEAVGKTFEAIALAGYPPATSMDMALSRLHKDTEASPSMEVLTATYSTMQQLLPGETQDAAALAMGQTYEQLDKEEEGRLGKRGEENAEAAAPKPSS